MAQREDRLCVGDERVEKSFDGIWDNSWNTCRSRSVRWSKEHWKGPANA